MGPLGLIRRYRAFQEMGVLGMNRRNHSYISRYNPRSLYPLVDNKLKTKEWALEHMLSTPELLGVVENQHDVAKVEALLANRSGFCIKPAKGSGGKGILVVKSVSEAGYEKANGEVISLAVLERHISNILAGLFSLGGAADVAMVEALLQPSSLLSDYSYQGVPDIRVIVFCGVPVMAMIRLACSASQGKANLHQGAIGVGLNLANGKAINAVQKDQCVKIHPDTEADLLSLCVPNWNALLQLACECYEHSGLGYLGVDLVIDEHKGPTLLELNARPGLSIQIANQAGLLPRLRRVEALKKPEKMSVEAKIHFAQNHFCLSV